MRECKYAQQQQRHGLVCRPYRPCLSHADLISLMPRPGIPHTACLCGSSCCSEMWDGGRGCGIVSLMQHAHAHARGLRVSVHFARYTRYPHHRLAPRLATHLPRPRLPRLVAYDLGRRPCEYLQQRQDVCRDIYSARTARTSPRNARTDFVSLASADLVSLVAYAHATVRAGRREGMRGRRRRSSAASYTCVIRARYLPHLALQRTSPIPADLVSLTLMAYTRSVYLGAWLFCAEQPHDLDVLGLSSSPPSPPPSSHTSHRPRLPAPADLISLTAYARSGRLRGFWCCSFGMGC
ncbi:hypothetical protein DFH06DRAFT_1427852 [Mycena polygramma]|nr:hypothetical protein DFH06DRAFT_1427852 [Mycena polygramma]